MADERSRLRDDDLGTASTRETAVDGAARGEKIGPYRVEVALGQGGMGEVVLAYDERLDRHVAIKRIRLGARATPTDRARFRREARAAARLSHPAIVQIHDILSDGSGEAIVMERVEGESVAERLRHGPLEPADALRLAREVAEALAEAHRIGVVHRDIKAENVMITPGGHAKVLDFGLAKRFAKDPLGGGSEDDTLTHRGALLGTARTMSPEQAGGRPVDHRTDLFSLGVLLYEMLAGATPFRGRNTLETLRRIQSEPPRSLAERRPDLPEEVVALVGRLLEKEPHARPPDASAVARELAEIEARRPASTPGGDVERLSDAPTASIAPPVVLQDTPSVLVRGEPGRRPVASRGALVVAGAAAALVLVLVAALAWRGLAPAAGPLRVALPRPEIAAAEPSPELELAASAVRVAALSTLAELQGVAPVEPAEIGEVSGPPTELARAVAADEVLLATLEPREGGARILLRRVRGAGGEVLWAGSFDAPVDKLRMRLLAEAVAAQIQVAYPRRPLREDASRLEVTPETFAEFLEVHQRIESGDVAWPAELERLEAIAERSPRFLAAHLRGVATAWTLYSDTRDVDYLRRGDDLLRRARELAPDDPRLLFWSFRFALARGRRDEAEAVLVRLERRSPQEPAPVLGRSHLAEHDGDLEAAIRHMEGLVERVPSWRHLYRLADLESRRGRVDEARRHLEELLRRSPGHTWGLAPLARIELLYGDLERAEELYEVLVERKPHRSYYTNLGLVRFLLGRYPEARESYLKALEIDPDHRAVRLNLADVELASGEVETARARYRGLLEDLEESPRDSATSMIRAQCLVRLGDAHAAVAATLETLQRHPDESEIAYEAALVYALAGDVASALVNVEKALARGYQARWFTVPGFEALREEPRFRALVERAAAGE